MFDFTVFRSRRKTLAVIVRDGKVIVRAPYRVSDKRLILFLKEKDEWIRKKVGETVEAKTALQDVVNRSFIMYFGKRYAVIQCADVQCSLAADRFYVPDSAPFDKTVSEWFKAAAKSRLKRILDETASAIGISYGSFKISAAKTQWGSCNAKGRISLNYRLIMLDEELIEYVIVHELCHITELNHSSKFWALGGANLPDYKKRRSVLKNYGALLRELPY